MTANVADQGRPRVRGTPSSSSVALPSALRVAVPPLLFGLRLWASVCLALYVAFWLQLDNPFWAGTSAAIVCQPQLGASLRKGWFRMVGTLVGATMIVVLTACFPQDRIAFLALLALWGAICAFAATVFRNFASYSAALAGYTAAIIAADTLGATGGPSPEVFMLAVTRASEICIGIVCAGIVLAGTDLGGVQRQLAASFAALAAEVMGRFAGTLAVAGSELPDTQAQRRELVQRVIALDPTIDQAIGESSQLRYYSATLQRAVLGLLTALDGWRWAAMHLPRLLDDTARQQAEAVLRSFPAELRSVPGSGAPPHWMADPLGLYGRCERAAQTLLALPARTPSLRLLADQTARGLVGILYVVEGLALLVDAPPRPRRGDRKFRLNVPDWLPALLNGGRAFVAIGAVELFWVVTAWPSGALAIEFVAIVLLLLSPRSDQAYAGALALTLGAVLSVFFAAIIEFAVLPALDTFAAFCVAIGLFYIPAGFVLARSRQPAVLAVFTAMALAFMPLLAPTNQMTYDTAQYYNAALSIVVGCAAAAFSFRLLPPLSHALRTRRLLAFALRDLRRLAVDRLPPSPEDWEGRMYGRVAALPDDATPLQRAQLLAALALGSELIRLRQILDVLGLGPALEAPLVALAQGHSATAVAQLARLDRRLASLIDVDAGAHLALRARASILAIFEGLDQHAAYFGAGVRT
jgi:uncharacterized membrane protein YccC